MTLAFNELNSLQISYSMIFLCLSIGFAVLYMLLKKQASIFLWSASALSNSVGFFFWSGYSFKLSALVYLLGEVFHILGFFLLVFGAIRFVDLRVKKGVVIASVAIWIALWAISLFLISYSQFLAAINLKILRGVLFIVGGMILINKNDKSDPMGKSIAGSTLFLWALFIAISIAVKINSVLYFGILIGLHVLSCFGMVVMIIDRIRIESESKDKLIKQLEGILPICSYCKKIRNEENQWIRIEEFIEDKTEAEFSHGICPDCFAKHRPDR